MSWTTGAWPELHRATRPRSRRRSEHDEERQAQDGEVIALDALEEVDAEALELVGADAGEDGVARGLEIPVDHGVRQGPHASASPSRPCLRDDRAVADDRGRRMQRVPAAGQSASCVRGGGPCRPACGRPRPSRSRVWSAPTTTRPGAMRDTARALARPARTATPAGRAPRRPSGRPRPLARRYRAVTTSTGMPAACSSAAGSRSSRRGPAALSASHRSGVPDHSTMNRMRGCL